MPDPAILRDSTQILLPCGILDEHRKQLEAEFTVTMVEGDRGCRIIGSPIEIKAAGNFLARHGVNFE